MRRIRKLRLLAVLAIFGLLGLSMFMFGLILAIRGQIPQLDPANWKRQQNGVVYANDGHSVLLVLRGSQSRTIVPDSEISPWIKYAIVAIEDKRFWEHRGVDVHGMLRALYEDVTQGHVVQGGSTITQQFIKQASSQDQRSIARKLKEAALAWQLEQKWDKTRILDAYLNTIYFGNQAYGIEQACRIYFGHGSQRMTIAEAALLAGIPQDPTLYDPVRHPEHSRARRHEVLVAMLQQQLIDRQQFLTADRTPLPKAQDVRQPATQGKAPYFANYVRGQLLQTFGERKVFGGGLKVTTTIDLGLQKLAQQAVLKWLPSETGPQAALVALDAKTGAVLAMVGGRNYHESQFNLATQKNRQVGSSFKPFVLATALREGVAPQSVLVSKPVTIDAGGRLWKVNNYEGEYMGPIDLATAMVHSDNSVYSQLTALVGPAQVAKTARMLGIGGLKPYFSIGLGAQGVSAVDMARAYAAFANGGLRIDGALTGNEPRAIATVDQGTTRLVNAVTPQRELSANDAATIDQILQGVVQSGTGTAAALPNYQVAGKTGTTENEGDAWFVGFTPQVVVAVWVGYPKGLVPMTTEFHGGPVVGGTYPALIFKSFMEKALPYLKIDPETFPPPQSEYESQHSVVLRDGRLSLDNGNCKNAATLALYSTASLPQASCKPNEVDVPSVVGEPLAAARRDLEAQPLTPAVVYKPAAPKQKLGVVLGQFPKGGTLSSYDKVTLVLAKPLHGVVPRLVGLPVRKAQTRLAQRHLQPVVSGGTRGKVASQDPAPGVAAAPGMQVTLVVKAG
ncbi:MAG TPA: PBP1A family penicillin-binding protein [Gaiellaceae bacterium]|nr:PBP1A family penicillin-binding protein [Gaiellaceae bacterium]